ncbi:MAG: mycofactocin biosynthesis glycosyltransferase MftF [Streptosporangiaceae bacterium]
MTIPPLPDGFRIELDRFTKQLPDGALFGGSPARVLQLTTAGQAALAELRERPVESAAAGVLARRLTDAGLAHPLPPQRPAEADLDVTVIVPVRDRAAMLDRCLRATGHRYRVVVVDDGSADPGEIAAVADRHGALLRRRPVTGGPAAARNTGLAGPHSELVAFLDSDCVPPAGWISELAAHLADPLVAAVAPRIVAADAGDPAPAVLAAARYDQACSSLDLGAQPARVVPSSRVAYVPTAALLVRRAALAEVAEVAARAAAGGDGEEVFDRGLRYGEDVDLIWRLHKAGWRIRYEPSVEVPHQGPANWPALLGRRFRYGTSAAPLAVRHPANMAPLVLQPWPAATVAALLARRPVIAASCLTASWLNLTAAVRRAGLPADGALPATLTSVHQTWLGVGRYATQFAAPVLAAALAAPGGATARRRWGRRAAVASLLLGPPLSAYRQRRPALDPGRFTAAHIADDVCYGAGVWSGCRRERTIVPVTPVISRRPVPVAGQPAEGES